jgi:catechol 2,3-dioxygenase-like lactoylglutathione lyase family enzyme
MITGAHAILYSRDADADRAFLRDVLGLRGVDAGGGWLIFALPPSEVAVHPAEGSDRHELYLMVDDVAALVRALKRRRVRCSPVTDQRWGLLTTVTLPGGGELGIYEPRHPRATEATSRSGSRSGSGSRSARRDRG